MSAADTIEDAAERFARDVANHQMTVLHDDGLYRHLRFKAPDTGFYWFELVTWPGALAVRGDMGGYLFSRTTDMFEFFRARSGWNSGTVNPGYWAEKLPDGARSVQQYSEGVFVALVEECLSAYEKARTRLPTGPARPSLSPTSARQLLADAQTDGETGFEQGARNLLTELESGGIMTDTWEWDLSDWTYQYLWMCHAIQWGIDLYDAARKPTVETVVTAGAVL